MACGMSSTTKSSLLFPFCAFTCIHICCYLLMEKHFLPMRRPSKVQQVCQEKEEDVDFKHSSWSRTLRDGLCLGYFCLHKEQTCFTKTCLCIETCFPTKIFETQAHTKFSSFNEKPCLNERYTRSDLLGRHTHNRERMNGHGTLQVLSPHLPALSVTFLSTSDVRRLQFTSRHNPASGNDSAHKARKNK